MICMFSWVLLHKDGKPSHIWKEKRLIYFKIKRNLFFDYWKGIYFSNINSDVVETTYWIVVVFRRFQVQVDVFENCTLIQNVSETRHESGVCFPCFTTVRREIWIYYASNDVLNPSVHSRVNLILGIQCHKVVWKQRKDRKV